jgi:hypothetical protein
MGAFEFEAFHMTDVESFDETLDKNIWSLGDQRLKLDQQVAVKRRTKPQEIQATLRRAFEKQDTVNDEGDAMDLDTPDDMPAVDRKWNKYTRSHLILSRTASTIGRFSCITGGF